MNEIYKKLTDQIKNHNQIFIMAHKNLDLDALGSIVSLCKIIQTFGKVSYIFKNEQEENTSILKAIENLQKAQIEVPFVSKNNYSNYVTEDSLVIILDTHKKSMVECGEILDIVRDIIVIDHHIRSGEVIENTVFTSINANLSSMNEFMVGYLKYLNKSVEPTLATIMLAGIEVDTNAFNTKTSITTYEAAAILARLGADNIVKQELLQENKEIYMNRQKLILNSFRVGEYFEICVLDDKIYERKDLAIVSLELLKFEDVEASFTIGKTSDHSIGISARSLGRINVEHYMSLLGGGGHITDAAAQMVGTDLEEVKKLLLKTIEGS